MPKIAEHLFRENNCEKVIEYIRQTLVGCFPFDEDLLNTKFSEQNDHSQNKPINMNPAVILTTLIAVTAALRIPSQHSTQSVVVLDTEDIEVACSIFCIGLSKFDHFNKYLILSDWGFSAKCCPSGFCVALWESC